MCVERQWSGLCVHRQLFNGIHAVMVMPWGVVWWRFRAPDSSYGVADRQSLGLSPGHDTCVLNTPIKNQTLSHYILKKISLTDCVRTEWTR